MGRERDQNADWEHAWERGCAAMAGVTRRRVSGSSPGIEIALLDWGGEGDLIVLHHATGFCGANLAPIANGLRDRYRVIAIDARGHGDSTSISPSENEQAYGWSTLAEDFEVATRAILQRVGAKKVKLAVGHSFGGALVLAAAQRDPDLIEKALLCDPVIFSPPTEAEAEAQAEAPSRKFDLAAGARNRRNEFDSFAAAYAHFASKRLFSDFPTEALSLYVGEGLREAPNGGVCLKCEPAVEAAVFENAALSSLFEDVEKVRAEVLLLHATQGNFDRERYDALIARIPHGRVESLEVGHLFPMEEPARVLAAIDEMMSSGGGS
ncbi:MAG: alpha/beta hydrolase [Myxococcales bacterium]|nr:alpha/beta hydrolase [Myxococcales bacterium]HIK83759.1 alpha/beta hydrolase [Myxococcales bacterium]